MPYLFEGLGAGIEGPVPVPHVGAGETVEAVLGDVDEHGGSVGGSVFFTSHGAPVQEELQAVHGQLQRGWEELEHHF